MPRTVIPLDDVVIGASTPVELFWEGRAVHLAPMFPRRLVALLITLGTIGIPAGVLASRCPGGSCTSNGGPPAHVPFCPLPRALRSDIAAGYRDGRSPDVLAVARVTDVLGASDPNAAATPWPTTAAGDTVTSVPVAFWETGVSPSARIPPGTASTRSRRRSRASCSCTAPTQTSEQVSRSPGSRTGPDHAWCSRSSGSTSGPESCEPSRPRGPFLRKAMRSGAGTLQGTTGSLPLDPAATLTTIGTGGLPDQHGITGTLIRTDRGTVVRAWGPVRRPR